MRWSVVLSEPAEKDLVSLYKHIAEALQAPEAAKGQYERILSAVYELDHLPERFPVYHEEPWQTQGIRWFPVDNYLVFYFVDQSHQRVVVTRVFYKGRKLEDLEKRLK